MTTTLAAAPAPTAAKPTDGPGYPWRMGNEAPLPAYPPGGPKIGPWSATVNWTEDGALGTVKRHEVNVNFENDPDITYNSFVLDERTLGKSALDVSGPGFIDSSTDRDLAKTFRAAARAAGTSKVAETDMDHWPNRLPKEWVSVRLGTQWVEDIPGHQQLVSREWQFPISKAPAPIKAVLDGAKAYRQAAIEKGLGKDPS